MKNVGIIGAGIFGCSAALELANRGFKVTIFDGMNNILEGASTINHLRHHYGFHYPRSRDTVNEVKVARVSFEAEYGTAISHFFDDYYGVSKVNSKTTPEDFIKFCDNMGLPYEIAWPEEKYMNRSKVGTCVKTPERVYDPDILRGLILKRIRNTQSTEFPIDLRLNHKIVAGRKSGNKKILVSLVGNRKIEYSFDILINATYSNFNNFNKWFDFPRKKLLYELVELIEIYVPNTKKIGLTIMDGEFSAVLPRGEKGTFTLGHVRESVLKAIVSDDLDCVKDATENTQSNHEKILLEGINDFPFLKDAEFVKSLFITRVVKPYVDATDERPSEITNYGDGMYSIFGGKVITSIEIAKKISDLIEKETK